jgi:hypothetical protein
VVSSVPREMWVRALNGTAGVRFLCIKHDGEQAWNRPVNHLVHMMYVLWINGFYNLSVNIILTKLVFNYTSKKINAHQTAPKIPSRLYGRQIVRYSYLVNINSVGFIRSLHTTAASNNIPNNSSNRQACCSLHWPAQSTPCSQRCFTQSL